MPTTRRRQTKRYAVRKPSDAARQRANGRRPAARHAGAFPGWGELEAPQNERLAPRRRTLFSAVSTARFVLLVLAFVTAITLYVGHVYATRNLLTEVQQLRRENLQLHLKHDRVKGAYDRATGPAVIYERAHQLGLEAGVAYGPTVVVE